MAIKKKDGSPYRISRPNPIMLSQDFWEGGKTILHNFQWPDAEAEAPPRQRAAPRPVPVVEVPEPKSPEPKPAPRPKADIMTAYCLPARVVERYDGLYGEHRSAVSYGEQFTFESVVVSRDGLSLGLWTTAQLGRMSVIFLPRELQWWRVDSVSPRESGAVVTCVPSDFQPSFAT